jgi:hypothetical protein
MSWLVVAACSGSGGSLWWTVEVAGVAGRERFWVWGVRRQSSAFWLVTVSRGSVA